MPRLCSTFRGPRLRIGPITFHHHLSAIFFRNGGSCVAGPTCACPQCFSGSDCSVIDEQCLWRRDNATQNTSAIHPAEQAAATTPTTILMLMGESIVTAESSDSSRAVNNRSLSSARLYRASGVVCRGVLSEVHPNEASATRSGHSERHQRASSDP